MSPSSRAQRFSERPRAAATRRPHTIGSRLVGSIAMLVGATMFVFFVPTGAQAGSFTGTNGRIAFTQLVQRTADDSKFEVVTINKDGTGWVNLTPEAELWGFQPDWSADGKKIAFQGATADVPNGAVWTMNADGTGKVARTDATYDRVENPSWSPDGKKIVFTAFGPEGGGKSLFVLTLADDSVAMITHPEGNVNDEDPNWSPAGGRIVYSHNDVAGGVGMSLRTINTDGTGDQVVLGAPIGNVRPSWNPAGTRLLLDNGGGVHTIKPDGSDDQPIPTAEDGAGVYPSWSPDGLKIVYSVGEGDPSEVDLRTVNIDGTGDTLLFRDAAGEAATESSWGVGEASGTPPTSAPTTSTTSTTVVGGATTTTSTTSTTGPNTTTTTSIGGFANTTTTTRASSVRAAVLARTGSDHSGMAAIAVALMLLGAALIRVGAEPRPKQAVTR